MHRLIVELLGARMAIVVPDDEWARFMRLMWKPFLATEVPAGVADSIEIRPHHAWAWELRAGDEVLAASDDRWFLSAELRYWVVRRAIESSKSHLLHASLVSRDGRALLLLAESGGGKTTLSIALAAAGWTYHGDDLVAVDPASLEVMGLPTPAGIRDAGRWPELRHLWQEAAPWPPVKSFLVPAAALLERSGESLPAEGLAFLAFTRGAAPVLETVSAAEATLLCVKSGASRHPASLATYAALCRLTKCARLRYGSSEDAVRLVERLWGGRRRTDRGLTGS